MHIKTLTLTAVVALGLSGLSVWSSVAEIDREQVLSQMKEKGIYQPVPLSDSDPRSAVPQTLLEQLESPNANTKGEA